MAATSWPATFDRSKCVHTENFAEFSSVNPGPTSLIVVDTVSSGHLFVPAAGWPRLSALPAAVAYRSVSDDWWCLAESTVTVTPANWTVCEDRRRCHCVALSLMNEPSKWTPIVVLLVATYCDCIATSRDERTTSWLSADIPEDATTPRPVPLK